VVDEVVSTLRIAPTVAALLGIPPPPAATEPPL
jgi:arylsulfatase A-like enzyme